jgi:hypothetical protein
MLGPTLCRFAQVRVELEAADLQAMSIEGSNNQRLFNTEIKHELVVETVSPVYHIFRRASLCRP